jgi:hypothetical protein
MNPEIISRYNTDGTCNASRISGNCAYIANGDEGMLVLDISNPGNPIFRSQVWYAGNCYNLFISGNHAYTANGDAGVHIYNISNPTNPGLVSTFDTPGDARDVFVYGQYVFVADMDSGMAVYDVANMQDPLLIGRCYNIPGRGKSINRSGNFVFIGCDNHRMYVIDVTDPQDPYLDTEFNTGFGEISQITINGDYAYLAVGNTGAMILDISNPLSPILAGTYNTPGSATGIAQSGSGVFVADSYGLLALQFSLLDINQPASNLPQDYLVTSNWPNPFNAKTMISFTVGKPSNVTLEIYDILGRQLSRNDLGNFQAGEHRLSWDGSQMVSGVYFYKVNADNNAAMGKMTILK